MSRRVLATASKLATHSHFFDLAMGARMFASQRVPDVFAPNTAEFVAAAGSASSIPRSMGLPEVVVTGRANVGKSSLLNAVMKRRKLVASSKKPGRTKTLTFFHVGPKSRTVILVDAPGYGNRGRPEWGELFNHYLETRHELSRVYILVNAKHGLNQADKLMLQNLDERIQSGDTRWTLQAIITKADLVPFNKLDMVISSIKQSIFDNAPTCLPPIVTASLKSTGLGIDDVRRSIVEACGLARSTR